MMIGVNQRRVKRRKIGISPVVIAGERPPRGVDGKGAQHNDERQVFSPPGVGALCGIERPELPQSRRISRSSTSWQGIEYSENLNLQTRIFAREEILTGMRVERIQ